MLDSNILLYCGAVTTTGVPRPLPPYLRDIKQQPDALQRFLDAGLSPDCRSLLERLATFDRVVMTGMGASLSGLYPGFLRLAEAGTPVWQVETAELLGQAGGLVTDRTLLWVTSQSGRSAEITALATGLRVQPAAILAVTNDTASPLAQSADAILELHSGAEHTVGTRSYLNTLVATAMAVSTALREASDPTLMQVPDRVAEYLEGWDDLTDRIDQTIADSNIFVLGRGASLAAAITGALIIKEASRRPAEGMSVPQFRHGPLEMAGPGVTALVLSGRPEDHARNRRMLSDLNALGAKGVWCDESGDVGTIPTPGLLSRDTQPVAEILPLQLLSVVLAQRDGHEPGAFRNIGKVTTSL